MRKMPFGEGDFLVRMLTKDFGKMDVLAKGARKSASKLNAHLDMLNYIRVQFVKPAIRNFSEGWSGERIPTLTDAEIISRFDDWFLGADSISVAGRVLQILDLVIMPGASDEKLFSMATSFFAKANDENGAVVFLRDFFEHEGHGHFLPDEHEQHITKLWPSFKSTMF